MLFPFAVIYRLLFQTPREELISPSFAFGISQRAALKLVNDSGTRSGSFPMEPFRDP